MTLKIALDFHLKMSSRLNYWEKEIIDNWRASRKLPRKKKKKVRKSLLIDWSICQHGKQLFN